MSEAIDLSWGSLGDGFLMQGHDGKLFAGRPVTADDRDSAAILAKSFRAITDALMEARTETIIQIGGSTKFCEEAEAFYKADLMAHGMVDEPPVLGEYFTPSDREDPTPREKQTDFVSCIIPMFAIHDEKCVAHLMLGYTKELNKRKKEIAIRFEVHQIYTTPQYEHQAFELDLHIAASNAIRSIITANVTDLPAGFYLRVVQETETGISDDALHELTPTQQEAFFEMLGTCREWIEFDSLIAHEINDELFMLVDESEDSAELLEYIPLNDVGDVSYVIGKASVVKPLVEMYAQRASTTGKWH